ncbi:beta-1,3-galactosyltransferase 1-like [Octopus vulgaris]|uniref:Hexosyltransferase n=1 Tax=Octopus vulgaris TaxID=6645 RepID=A0AA36FME8_OCTVU|nr:beta-1,3-galactosyltransferase 1-like [Octopus vulgaris]
MMPLLHAGLFPEDEIPEIKMSQCNLESWYQQYKPQSASQLYASRLTSYANWKYFSERAKALKSTSIFLRKRPKGSFIPKMYYDDPIPYEHNFKRLINEPNLCSQHGRIFIIYAIITMYSHFDRREILRKSFENIPSDSCARGVVIKHVFLFAKTGNSTIESLIQKESEIYHDILQEDFKESYMNVSIKAIMAWKWVREFCANAEYVAMLNDESLVDHGRLVSWLGTDFSKGAREDHFALCYPVGLARAHHLDMERFRMLEPQKLYQGKFYPRYCHGFAYVAHIKVFNKLYLSALKNTHFMPTDVWIGILTEKLNLRVLFHQKQFKLYKVLEHYQPQIYSKSPAIVAVCDIEDDKFKTVDLMQQVYKVISQEIQ